MVDCHHHLSNFFFIKALLGFYFSLRNDDLAGTAGS